MSNCCFSHAKLLKLYYHVINIILNLFLYNCITLKKFKENLFISESNIFWFIQINKNRWHILFHWRNFVQFENNYNLFKKSLRKNHLYICERGILLQIPHFWDAKGFTHKYLQLTEVTFHIKTTVGATS